MAINVTSANTTTQITANTTGDVYIVLPDVFVTTTGDAVNGANTTFNKSILIHGGLVAEIDGIELGSTNSGGSNSVHVTPTGSIFAEQNGVDSEGGSLHFLNEGSIFARSDAVFLFDNSNEFINYGSVISLVDAVDATGDFTKITNYGLIQGADEALEVSGNGIVITNYGTIKSTDSSATNEGIEVSSNPGDSTRIIHKGCRAA